MHRRPGVFGIEPYFSELVAGMEDALGPLGAAVLMRAVDGAEQEIADYERWAASGEIAGVVVTDFVADDPRPPLLERLGLPAILLGGGAGALSTFDVDNERAMLDAVAFLIGLGHTRIGRVSGPPELLHSQARGAAFESALVSHRRAGVDASGLTIDGDYSAEAGADATRRMLAHPHPPTAIIFDNDVSAAAGLAEALALGVRVPADLSILAWDDSTLCQLSEPPLSVMRRDTRALGADAGRALLAVVRGEDARVLHAPNAQIVERGTTGPA